MLTKEEWRRRRKIQRMAQMGAVLLIGITLLLLIIFGIRGIIRAVFSSDGVIENAGEGYEVSEMLLSMNDYSRPGVKLEKVSGIVLHYSAAPGLSAVANRDYYEKLGKTHATHASTHLIIGLDGEIVQCIPLTEAAYASQKRNGDTLAIEYCHADEDGLCAGKTYTSMVQLCAWLCNEYDIGTDAILRHYDVTGEKCPAYYVDNKDAWEKFLADVGEALKKL